MALAISTDYFGVKPEGRALAKALYQPFQFTVIAARPECWKVNFEEVGIALCRTLTDEADLLNRVISSLESAVLDEIVGRLERNECSQRDMSHEQGFEGEASGGRRCNRLGTPGRRSAYFVKLALFGRGGDSPEERIFTHRAPFVRRRFEQFLGCLWQPLEN